MTVTRCVEVVLTIPDNEARTALSTLQRLGVELEGLERADLYRFEVEPAHAEGLLRTLSSLETVYNPNKHALRVRSDPNPGPGDVWVHEIPHGTPAPQVGPVQIAGRVLRGVHAVERFTAWRVIGTGGGPAGPEVTRRASETLLCNASFQKATMVEMTR